MVCGKNLTASVNTKVDNDWHKKSLLKSQGNATIKSLDFLLTK